MLDQAKALKQRWANFGNDRRYERHIRRSTTADGDLFRPERQLPDGYGARMSERSVEFGWSLAQKPRGQVLDAGSTFNHPYVLPALVPLVDHLTIVTLAPEDHSDPSPKINYLYEDLRTLTAPDDAFDTVMCISTLEHVGADTKIYGGDTEIAEDPQAEALRAVRELVRVARPGGKLLLSMPFGSEHSLGWVRTFTPENVDEVIETIGPRQVNRWLYRDTGNGWQLANLATASQARLQKWQSEAIVCLAMDL